MRFDFVICSSLLHELEEPIKMLEEIEKVCSDNTILHINVPNAISFHRLLAKEMGLINDVHGMSARNNLLQQNTVYDIDMLRRSVERVGFKEIESGSYFVKPFTHTQMHEMMRKDIINEQVLNGLYGMEKYMPGLGSEIYINAKKNMSENL